MINGNELPSSDLLVVCNHRGSTSECDTCLTGRGKPHRKTEECDIHGFCSWIETGVICVPANTSGQPRLAGKEPCNVEPCFEPESSIPSTDLLAQLGMNGKDLFECGVHLARCFPPKPDDTIQNDRDRMWDEFLASQRGEKKAIAKQLANARPHGLSDTVRDKVGRKVGTC